MPASKISLTARLTRRMSVLVRDLRPCLFFSLDVFQMQAITDTLLATDTNTQVDSNAINSVSTADAVISQTVAAETYVVVNVVVLLTQRMRIAECHDMNSERSYLHPATVSAADQTQVANISSFKCSVASLSFYIIKPVALPFYSIYFLRSKKNTVYIETDVCVCRERITNSPVLCSTDRL